MAGKFVIGKRSNGDFQFNLKAGNGQVILASQGYADKGGCRNGIESVQKNSPDEAHYERKTASDGRYHFNLKAANHQVIGSSQMYASEAARETGISSVKTNGASTTIKDLTA